MVVSNIVKGADKLIRSSAREGACRASRKHQSCRFKEPTGLLLSAREASPRTNFFRSPCCLQASVFLSPPPGVPPPTPPTPKPPRGSQNPGGLGAASRE